MGVCELCGRGKISVFRILVSGAQISACAACCEKRGHAISKDRPRANTASPSPKPKRTQRPKFEPAGDFHKRIQRARRDLGYTVQELARIMNIRAQDLNRYEAGNVPTDSVAKKLEKELGIKILVEVTQDNSAPIRKGSSKSLTIADMFDEMMRESSDG
tara:strand:- start:493 stop:969 length:477 start_codon:yes stop_codon:yes gene_type:complete